jgi:hypothetical protein
VVQRNKHVAHACTATSCGNAGPGRAKSVYKKLLADLTTAALTIDRKAALAAFEKDRGGLPLYLAAAAIIVWSVTLVIVPLLPAFSVKRRLLRPLAGLEARGFAALGCRRVQDLELDLVAQLLLIAQVAYIGTMWLYFGFFASPSERAQYGVDPTDPLTPIFVSVLGVIGALLVFLFGLAGVELRNRYAMRRTDTARRHALVTCASLRASRSDCRS